MNLDLRFKTWFLQRAKLNLNLAQNSDLEKSVEKAAALIFMAINSGNKIIIFGNGGSAAEAQHFAAELVGKFEKERRALPAIALTADTSVLTAQGNDYGFERIFSRQIEALANSGDVAVGLTTSDININDKHSYNILRGLQAAQAKGAKRIGLFSQKTSFLLGEVDVPIIVPHANTAIIQEVHLAIIHFISQMIESQM